MDIHRAVRNAFRTLQGHRLRIGTKGLAIALLTAMAAVVGAQPMPSSHTPQIWMASFEPPWRAVKGWVPNDYMQLFQPDAPWPIAAKGVKVFEISKLFVQKSSDQELSYVIASLSRRGILLAMQGTPLIVADTCGRSVESYGAPNDMVEQATRIKRLGGVLSYIALDEPLFFGHVFKGRAAMNYEDRAPTVCQASIAELARETAVKLAQVRKVFPDVQVGDVEPVGVFESSGPEFQTMLTEWFHAYEAATSRKFAFFDIDCAWLLPPWQAQFDDAVRVVRQAGVPLGVIFGGTRADPSDGAWLQSARQHIRLVEGKLGSAPDQVIFQTWTDHPRRMLPETDPGSFTNLIKTYVQGH